MPLLNPPLGERSPNGSNALRVIGEAVWWRFFCDNYTVDGDLKDTTAPCDQGAGDSQGILDSGRRTGGLGSVVSN